MFNIITKIKIKGSNSYFYNTQNFILIYSFYGSHLFGIINDNMFIAIANKIYYLSIYIYIFIYFIAIEQIRKNRCILNNYYWHNTQDIYIYLLYCKFSFLIARKSNLIYRSYHYI